MKQLLDEDKKWAAVKTAGCTADLGMQILSSLSLSYHDVHKNVSSVAVETKII